MAQDYLKALPTDAEIREGIMYAHDLWRDRNRFIAQVREMLIGRNKIDAPTDTPYKIRTVHSYSLAAIVNEKAARFTQIPQIQVVPAEATYAARKESSELELAINTAIQEMERRSDGDVWSRAVIDAIVIDEGVERIERAPAAFWPEVMEIMKDGSIELPFENRIKSELTIGLKKKYGLPIRSVYVPLENFFPIYEGPTRVESFEVELRSLRDVLRNPLFSEGKDKLAYYNSRNVDEREGLRTQVSIVHYVNNVWHAYYAMAPGTQTTIENRWNWPDYTSTELSFFGEPIFLFAYQHNLGRSIYNSLAGRYGGWKTSHNRIEGVGKGLIELNQATDELLSQALTNVRAKYWPTVVQKFDPEARGIETGTPPQPSNTREGQNIAIYKDESIEPMFQAVDDPMLPWLWDKFQDQLGRLGGSPVIFGQNIPGVETGYHQALQITQAEHLDEKIEQHLSIGAANRAMLMLEHIKAMDLGEVYTNATEVSHSGRRTSKYYTIDPAKLSPLPRIDAQVRRPRPVDFAANMRAAREATDDRGGKGALLSDDTVRSDILNLSAPDQEEHKIRVERQRLKIWESGVIDAKIIEALNIKLATQSVPTNTDPSNASPAALEAARQLMGQQPPPTNGTMNGAPTGQPSSAPLQTGQPTGQDQPEAAAGREIAGAMMGNGVTP